MASSSRAKKLPKYVPLQLINPAGNVGRSKFSSNRRPHRGGPNSFGERGRKQPGGNVGRQTELLASWPGCDSRDMFVHQPFHHHHGAPSNEQASRNWAAGTMGTNNQLARSPSDRAVDRGGGNDPRCQQFDHGVKSSRQEYEAHTATRLTPKRYKLSLSKSRNQHPSENQLHSTEECRNQHQLAQTSSCPLSSKSSNDTHISKQEPLKTFIKNKGFPSKETNCSQKKPNKASAKQVKKVVVKKLLNNKPPQVPETNLIKKQQTKPTILAKNKKVRPMYYKSKNKNKSKNKSENGNESKNKRKRKRRNKNKNRFNWNNLVKKNTKSDKCSIATDPSDKFNTNRQQSQLLVANRCEKSENGLEKVQHENEEDTLKGGKMNGNRSLSICEKMSDCDMVANSQRPQAMRLCTSEKQATSDGKTQICENRSGSVCEESDTGTNSHNQNKYHCDNAENNQDVLVVKASYYPSKIMALERNVQGFSTSKTSTVDEEGGIGSHSQIVSGCDKIERGRDRVAIDPTSSKSMASEENSRSKNTKTTSSYGDDEDRTHTCSEKGEGTEEPRGSATPSGAPVCAGSSDKSLASPISTQSNDTEEYYGLQSPESPGSASSDKTVCNHKYLHPVKQETLSQQLSCGQRSTMFSKDSASSPTTKASKSPPKTLTSSQEAVVRNIKKEPLNSGVATGGCSSDTPPLEGSLSNGRECTHPQTDEVNVRKVKEEPPDDEQLESNGCTQSVRCTCKLEPASQSGPVGEDKEPPLSVQTPDEDQEESSDSCTQSVHCTCKLEPASQTWPTTQEPALPLGKGTTLVKQESADPPPTRDRRSPTQGNMSSTDNRSSPIACSSSMNVGYTSMSSLVNRKQLSSVTHSSSLLNNIPSEPHSRGSSKSVGLPIPHLSTKQLSVFVINVDKTPASVSNILTSERESVSDSCFNSVSLFPLVPLQGNVPSHVDPSPVSERTQLMSPPLASSTPLVSNLPFSSVMRRSSVDLTNPPEGQLSGEWDGLSTSSHHSAPVPPLPSFAAEGVTFLVNHLGDIDERVNQVPFNLAAFEPFVAAATDCGHKASSTTRKERKSRKHTMAIGDCDDESIEEPGGTGVWDDVSTFVKKKKKHKRSEQECPQAVNSETVFESNETDHDYGAIEGDEKFRASNSSPASVAAEEEVHYKKKKRKNKCLEPVELPEAETRIESGSGKRKKKKKSSSSGDEDFEVHSSIGSGTNLDTGDNIEPVRSGAVGEWPRTAAKLELGSTKEKKKDDKRKLGEPELANLANFDDFAPEEGVLHDNLNKKKKKSKTRDKHSGESGPERSSLQTEIFTKKEAKSRKRKQRNLVEDVESKSPEDVEPEWNEMYREKKKKKKRKREGNEGVEDSSPLPSQMEETDVIAPKKKKVKPSSQRHAHFTNGDVSNDQPQSTKKKRKDLETESPLRVEGNLETKQDSLDAAAEDSAQRYERVEGKKKKKRHKDLGEDAQDDPVIGAARLQTATEEEGGNSNVSSDAEELQTKHKRKRKKTKCEEVVSEEFCFVEARSAEPCPEMIGSDSVVYEYRKKKKKKKRHTEVSEYLEVSRLEIPPQDAELGSGDFRKKKRKRYEGSTDNSIPIKVGASMSDESMFLGKNVKHCKGKRKHDVNPTADPDCGATFSRVSKKRRRESLERSVENVSFTATITLGGAR